MDIRERRELYLHGNQSEVELCVNCKHYYQHYVKCGTHYSPISDGHCCFPRLKSRRVYDVCDYFEQNERIEKEGKV